MYNCLILGSGRSGTSMVAGVLAKSGYFMGRNLVPPRPANPKGFFESEQINRHINEELLKPLLPAMHPGHGWLQILPRKIHLQKNPIIRKRIETMVNHKPFCYKDPRFCYTLPFWMPSLKKTKFICVFRHPANTATSIVKECNTAKYLRTIKMDLNIASRIWIAMYGSVIHNLQKERLWLFLRYDQLFEKETLDKIKKYLELDNVDYSFPEKKLMRPQPNVKLPPNALKIYDQLCKLANV